MSTSIFQWMLEVAFYAVTAVFYSMFFGASHFGDKCLALVNVTVYLVITPLFYLNGDPTFRRLRMEGGIAFALKKTLLG